MRFVRKKETSPPTPLLVTTEDPADIDATIETQCDQDDNQETTPLLETEAPAPLKHPSHRLAPVSRWLQFQRVIKASLAFSAACLLTFYPHLEPPLEDGSRRGNLFGYWPQTAASAILFFHPVKTIGAMFESLVAGFFGAAGGLLSAFLCAQVAVWTRAALPQYESLVAAAVLSILFLTTFALSYVRAKSSKPSVYTGTTYQT